MNDFDAYTEFTRKCVVYKPEFEHSYLERGLVGEVGEFLSALAKYDRGDYGEDTRKERISSELGDVLWFVARLSDAYELKLSDIVAKNVEKLSERLALKVIKGDGENRQ